MCTGVVVAHALNHVDKATCSRLVSGRFFQASRLSGNTGYKKIGGGGGRLLRGGCVYWG